MHKLIDNRGVEAPVKLQPTTGTRLLRCSWLILLAVLSLPALLLAQTSAANLSGRVTDSNGAVVQGANVQASNMATNESFKRSTNKDGLYQMPNLKPCRYQITVEKDGFKASSYISGNRWPTSAIKTITVT